MTIYAILDPRTGHPVYVGHTTLTPAERVAEHWKQRHTKGRNRQNPEFYGWLATMLIPPAYRTLAVVPFDRRYQEERRWTVMLRAKYDLFNISDGPAPLRRGPLTPEHRAKISAAHLARHRRLREGAVPSALAA